MLELDQQLTLALNGSDNLFLDNLMLTITKTGSWSLVIVALLIIIFKNNSLKESILVYVTMILLVVVADRLCSGLVKPMVERFRPAQDPQIMYFVDVVRGYRSGGFSFFSGHACNTSCIAMFLSLLFRSRKISVTLAFWCLSTTFTRLYLGVHYFGDVTVGLVVGCILGVVFHLVMEQVHNKIGKKQLVSEQFTSSGYMQSDMNTLMAVIFLNYIILVIIAMFKGIA